MVKRNPGPAAVPPTIREDVAENIVTVEKVAVKEKKVFNLLSNNKNNPKNKNDANKVKPPNWKIRCKTSVKLWRRWITFGLKGKVRKINLN